VTTAEITTTEAEARRLITRINLVFGSMLDQHDKLVELVEEAKATSAHVALGYPSWPAYVSAEFGELQARLGIDDRRVLVGALTATGLPTRTIAEVVGVNHSTVVRDQKQVVHDAPPVPDGPRPSSEFGAMVAEMGAPSRRRVAGRDGKTYTAVQPELKPPRRSPLPDSYSSAMWELRKSIERLEKLHADDRFQADRKEVANGSSFNLMVEVSMRLTALGRHLSGADRQLGEYRKNGKADYFRGDR